VIAKSHSSSAAPASLDEYLKVSQVASEFNLHPMTVRRATNSGSLQMARSNGHQRLIRRAWVYDWLGIPIEDNKEEKAVLCVCRVSSRGQLTSLEKQKELTQAFAAKEYPSCPIILSERIMSGIILDGPEVLNILDHILSGRVKAIVLTFADRLARAGLDLFRKLCAINNVRIHIIEGEETEDPMEQFQQDLMSYVTSYANRLSGHKNKKINGVEIEPEHLKEIFLSWKSGLSLADLEAKYSHLRNSKGQAYSFTVIHKRIRENLNALEIAYGQQVTSDVEDFLKERTKYTDDKYHTEYKSLYGAYVSFTRSEGHKPLSKPKFSKELDRLGVLERRFVNTKGNTAFRGVVLKRV
jgi:excisionase family DNA binding protein